MEDKEQWNRNDRDLLIELRTEMKNVRSDIGKLNDGIDSRLKLVEQGKLDRTEANRLQSEYLTVQGDHEERLRFLEKKMWVQAGAAGVLGAALTLAVQLLFIHYHL